MAFFGPQGIRDAISKSYQKHLRLAKQQGTPPGTSVHEVGMYGALATRYMAGGERADEMIIWVELTPFLQLEPNKGLEALAEYVVLKESPKDADKELVTKALETGLPRVSQEDLIEILSVARAKGVRWAAKI